MITLLFYELYTIAVSAKIVMFLLEVLFLIFIVLAIIGLITVVRFFVRRSRAKKETAGEYWRRTGKLRDN